MANLRTAPKGIAGIERFRAEIEVARQTLERLEASDDPDLRHQAIAVRLLSEARRAVVEAYDEGRPFISNNYCTAPELAPAMGLPWFELVGMPFAPFNLPRAPSVIDESVAMGLGTDLCTLVRTSIHYLQNDLYPVPTAAIGVAFPCDGMPMFHQVMGHSSSPWRDVPVFCPDAAPYFHDGSERSLDYFARELRSAAQFLETHTGHKLDLDKLKSIIEESNTQYELWQEYNDLCRVTPVPYGWEKATPFGTLAQGAGVGSPQSTLWFQELVDLAEKRVEAGQGAVTGREEIRMLWFDLPPVFGHAFLPWLEKEYGAVVVMHWSNNHSYTAIDTSSEEEIWRGMAKRCLFDTPMIRQANGSADNMVNDLVRIVEDYDIDVVIWPGHMGHKDILATHGIMREKCRELGVHFLDIRMDIWDQRFTTPDQIKDKFIRFFEAAGYA